VKCAESPLNYLDREVLTKENIVIVRCSIENTGAKNGFCIG